MSGVKKLTDDDLILLLNKANETESTAFNEIYDRYWARLLAQANYDLNNKPDAEECVQNVFINLWKNRASLTLRFKLSTYLYRAVKNQVLNKLKSRRAIGHVSPLSEAAEIGQFVPSADMSLLEKELLDILEGAINDLPEKCAKIYKMSRHEGKTNKEISTHLDIAEKTVEGHMTRALRHIAGQISASWLTILILFLY
ncbi:RNA polymerase sigma-70 factor [Mucilaginibacter mali]|uniref:RNA polymerase sigma-70 factor n=1 Tax=Mucilaginibacter mali TaxID=2740462 RepID=A0A7D4UKH2_9SPHI|nr:RNA polymerase sigma-70 factor [Mucilaginibacter mali]QKJ30662.1 RNA polymerase sigma-70 factor [Mucilaginibacter mali]